MDKKENENIPALNDNTRGTSLKKTRHFGI